MVAFMALFASVCFVCWLPAPNMHCVGSESVSWRRGMLLAIYPVPALGLR